jgi:hypothetical protein
MLTALLIPFLPLVLLHVACALVCALKGHWLTAIVGAPLLTVVAAACPASSGSWWDRKRSSPQQRARSASDAAARRISYEHDHPPLRGL